MTFRPAAFLALLASAATGTAATTVSGQDAPMLACELPEPTVLRQDGAAVLHRWELPVAGPWFSETLPQAAGYLAYRAAIRGAGGDLPRPIADTPTPTNEADRELWRREDLNVAAMYAGAGEVRPIRCLEAALFAVHDARYPALTRPTEFIAHVLRADGRLRLYLGASDQPFPPATVYGMDEVAADMAAGWVYCVVLHNHTIRTRDGRPALGVPVPSTSDVDFFRTLAVRLGVREVWVTNGMYTGVVAAPDLARFSGRPPVGGSVGN